MSNKYTNTLMAAAYSLGVHPEVLQQCLEPMREATLKLTDNREPDFFIIQSIKVAINKEDAN